MAAIRFENLSHWVAAKFKLPSWKAFSLRSSLLAVPSYLRSDHIAEFVPSVAPPTWARSSHVTEI
jgi:hypothetical protein